MESEQIDVTIHFNEEWYLYRYPDVAGAVKSGVFKNGLEHFLAHGQGEGRLGILPPISSPRLVNDPDGANWSPPCPVVVLIRTHKGDDKFKDLVKTLNATRNGFDLYALADRGRGEFLVEDVPVIWHSQSECGELGLSPARGLHFCGDFALYFALRALPAYQYYIMIEDDVAFTKGGSNLINEISEAIHDTKHGGPDLVCLELRRQDPVLGFEASNCARRYTHRFCFYCFYPFLMVSRRALSFMLTQRQMETLSHTSYDEIIHCETFTPSCLLAGGFKCMDLLELVPDCYSWQTMAMHLDSIGFGVPLSYNPELCSGVRMIHPCYTIDEFIRRLEYTFRGESADWQRLLRILRSPAAASVPPERLRKLWESVPKLYLSQDPADVDVGLP